MFLVVLLALAGVQSARSAAFVAGRFVETDGWKARITVDCLLKGKVCGSFRYETLACEGDLVYVGETPTGFEFRTELRAGRCLPACSVQVSSDFTRYAEVCKDSRHEGTLVAASTPPVVTPEATRSAARAPAPVAAARAAPAAPKLSGQVHYQWPNGDVFDGQMLDGKRNGKGRMAWASGQTYDGEWRDDLAEGVGLLVFVNGDRYQGPVKDGIPDGRGKMTLAKGDTYEGVFVNGIVDVEGTYTEKDGGRYTGQWKSGVKQGKGSFVWPNGQRYEGDWVGDRAEGQGVIVFANGDRYEGQIANGLPQGKGMRVFASEDRYEGNFVQGEAQGEGTYRWKNGDLFVGAWQKGKKVGQGRYTWPNGDYWVGEFADDRRTESGRMYITTLVASNPEATKVARQTDAMVGPADGATTHLASARANEPAIDRAKLLAIPMVAKELRDCQRQQGTDCAARVVADVLNDNLVAHKWQTMAAEKGAKDKGPVFEVDTNSVLEGGDVFSWLRSGDATRARNIGIRYACRPQTLEIQLVYHCSGAQAACKLDPNIDKYAGKVIPATDIRSWFKEACER